jgi:hypothetical protein
MAGIKLIEERPRYELLSANCQTFAILLLKALCKKGDDDQSIEELFWQETLTGRMGKKRR